MLYNELKEGIYILHENPEWIPPFARAFNNAGIEFKEILLTQGSIDLDNPPPKGIFWSRLSASSHTRGNTFSKEYGRAILKWLEFHNRRVINGSEVLEFEVSKVAQYLALNKAGFRTPKTLAVFGKKDLNLAKNFKTPFISKHNQGGKGLGVRLFNDYESFESYVNSEEFENAIDDINLIQEYIHSKQAFITRYEFIAGKFHYAVRVDTSAGDFELCPAEACELEKKPLPEFASGACDIAGIDKFSLREDIKADDDFVIRLENFLKTYKIEVAGIEVIQTPNDELVVYDINTNTNYNKAVEEKLRIQGKKAAADKIVEFLNNEFQLIKEKK